MEHQKIADLYKSPEDYYDALPNEKFYNYRNGVSFICLKDTLMRTSLCSRKKKQYLIGFFRSVIYILNVEMIRIFKIAGWPCSILNAAKIFIQRPQNRP